MDFFACILILVIYYIRPMEWITIFQMFNFVSMTALLGIIAILYREQGLPALKRIFATPIDWMMAAYVFWILYSSPDFWQAWASIKPWVFFYLIVSQTLTNHERIRKFLTGWSAVMMLAVLLALVSEIGFDPMDSYYVTHSIMKDRLVLNNSMLDNPNALGHHTAPLILFLYFQLVWNRPIFVKEVGIAILTLPLTCIYMTQSKGSYLTTFAALVAGQCFGRPKYVQAILLAIAITGGWAAVQILPRMEQLNQSKREEGIGGRVGSFIYGLETMNSHPNGIGWYRFFAHRAETTGVRLAAHSSYVECGADLGRFGLSIFLGVIYACFRTLVTAKTPDIESERTRRILFCLIISYTISSWMIDILIRAYFFIITATISAYHRSLNDTAEQPTPQPATSLQPLSSMMPNILPQNLLAPVAQGTLSTNLATSAEVPAPDAGVAGLVRKLKTRPTIVDLLLIWGITELWVWLWQYFIKHM